MGEILIRIYDWSGSGYIVLDTKTYAAGYMISGGLFGGAMSVEQMITEYIKYVGQGLISLIETVKDGIINHPLFHV